jgi:hypothetical protein
MVRERLRQYGGNMKLLFLHLSDIHMRSPKGSNPILNRTKQIIGALTSVTSECQICFITVSGDIAFSGKEQEYLIATEFFKQIEKEIISHIKNCKVVFYFVPGNHDCDFSLQNSLREIVIANYSSKTFDNSILDTCLQVQGDYEKFLSSWASTSNEKSPIERSISIQKIKVEDQIIEFRLINSALLSTLHERQGSLFFPTELLSFNSSDTTVSNIIITILHHPYNWFESANGRSIREILEATSDFILTGHEHEEDNFIKTRSNDEKVEYIEGGKLQDMQDQNKSSFNILFADLDSQTQRLHQFTWEKNNSYEETAPSTPIPLVRNSYRLRSIYTLDHSFDDFLKDTGAPFTHSMKAQIILDDIFVYPHLRIISNLSEDETVSPKILQNNFAGFFEDQEKVLLIGTEKSGKTCMVKVIYQDLRKRGFVPVLLIGDNLKKPDESHIIAEIEKAYQSQYRTPDTTSYNQLEQEKKVLIIDDFQNSPVNSRGRDIIVKILETRARIVILVGDENIRFDDLVDGKVDDLRLWKYVTAVMMPFGHEKRYELIKKWVFIGRTLTDDEHELMRRVSFVERVVSEIVGKNLAPSYPLFILGVLQQLEAQTPIKASMVSGSHGFLYETFITISLTRASRLKFDLDTQFGYLTELAYHLFSTGQRFLTDDQAYDWHQEYCKVYSRRLDFNEMKTNLISADILVVINGRTAFRYPYIFYYFLGRYFRDHINEGNIREHIDAMSHRLHHEESANVLMFLSYLSKDPIILSSIIGASKDLFSTYDECDIVLHTAFLKNLIDEIPHLILDGNDAESRRKDLLAKEDEIESTKPSPPEETVVDYTDIETDDQINELMRINVAFKTIQIMGQILRNYTGSLKGIEKLEIAQNAYSLGLRGLKFIYQTIEGSQEGIVQFLADILHEKHPKWSVKEIRGHVSNMVFFMSEGLSFVVTKQIADSVGHEDLSMTFDELLMKNSNISYQYIDLIIRLYNYKDFPEVEIFQLYSKVRRNPFAAQIVRHIVWYYFYIFPVNEALLQRVCKKLGIEIQPTLRDSRPKLLKG